MAKTKAKKKRKKVFGVGVYEEGKYPGSINGKDTKEYKSWNHMLERCYSKKLHKRRPSYVGCTVCDSWIYFQQYAEWYDQNFYQIKGKRMHLDKDILVRNNKIYSPKNCIFVPTEINTLLTSCKSKRGDLPIGITKERNGKFKVYCCNGKGEQEYLGTYDTKEEAFAVYKPFKEQVIREVVQRHENIIPEKYYKKLYLVLSKYEVRITD